MQEALYGKPSMGGVATGESSDDDETRRRKESKYDRGFGLPGQKNMKNKVKQQDEAKK